MSGTVVPGYIKHCMEEMKKTPPFYKIAFGFEIRFRSPDEDYGALDTGSTTLASARQPLAASNLAQPYVATGIQSLPPVIEIGVVCREVEFFVQRAVENNATLETSAKTKPWGAYVRDPDGLRAEICTPVA